MTQSSRRPASHKWAVVVLIIALLINGNMQVDGTVDTPRALMMVLSLGTLIAFFAAKRARRTFLLGAFTLAVVTLYELYSDVLQPAYDYATDAPGARANWHGIKLQIGISALFVWLAYAYTFGTASRAWYGLPARPMPKA